ncbi:protein of unknown function [Cupriavidus taiwanensis]|uniref:Uncharacterized protein n=1 Tax=Cupriavidus taiwanensis TaxID=164546 RepID=A0A375IGQ9_9BURK|nr:hypothetical protein CBM2588_A10159 [Cupriavidus taiwanensis]SOZ22856.1 hypothetical protein CBM2608_A20033 [Cupriavidus taiwanensis]SOZ75719.1 hypothetical protein CBM2622_A10111 [Cupriavidus taiwanensis]SOZ76181.1 hypothetical protein CBM2618_A10110 [Cupriavidus taiwanensis]SOZ79388.1 hypothetical protein CBM2621_A10112 [Cupriavidus taiwanensis]
MRARSREEGGGRAPCPFLQGCGPILAGQAPARQLASVLRLFLAGAPAGRFPFVESRQ